MSTLTEDHERNVRPWLDLIDALRSQGVHEDLPLPQIAVMGDQSSGKSSVSVPIPMMGHFQEGSCYLSKLSDLFHPQRIVFLALRS